MTYAAILIPAFAFAAGYCLGRSPTVPERRIEPLPKREIIAFETLRARRAERENGRG